nr:hypothetical protein [Tanacetum cinerariifolium]
MTKGKGTENQAHETVAPKTPGNMSATGPASEVSLEEEVAAMGPRLSKNAVEGERKTLPTMGLAADSTFVTPADTKGVSNPDSLSYAEPQPHPKQSITQFFEIPIENMATMKVQDTHSAENHIVPLGYFYELRRMPKDGFLSQYNKNLAQQVVMGSQLRLHFKQEVRLLKKARAQIARPDQRIQVREDEIKKLDQEVQGLQNQTSNLKTLLEAEADMKKAAEAKNANLTKELESLRTQAAFEEFKKYEDDRVEKRYVEMDARLDALSINFGEELYPHMLTAIASRRWVIGHGMRLAVMKCAESIELRQAFTNVVSAGIARGMSEGLAHVIEHRKVGRDLEVVEAYDPEANNKYLQALQELKDLKYLIMDQLEGLKDAPMEVIMVSLRLESDSREDAPKWIHDLRPSTSQLKIHVYLEVRDPRDHWAVKEEMLLEEAITANVSRAEKKKRCRVVCRTHGVGSAHHARFDGVPVSVPTIAPQGLAILPVNVATQTKTSEDDASLRLPRSKSLPPMYNLDWP